MLLGSMNYNNNMGFALTFLLTSIGIISIYQCHKNLAEAYVHFSGSEPAFAGEYVCFDFIVENQSAYSRSQLQFGHDDRPEICDALAAGERQQVSLRVNSNQRGWRKLPRLLISTRYPLGLFRAWAWINMDVAEIVFPRPASIATASMSHHTGNSTYGHRSSGDDDFSGLRDYRIGDPPKRIAWKILARSGDTMITEYDGGAHDLVWIDWDDYPTIDPEERISLLTRRVLDAFATGNPWGLRLPGNVIDAAQNATHRYRCLRALALCETDAQRGGT